MRKIIPIIAAVTFAFSLGGCKEEPVPPQSQEEQLRKTFPSEVKPMPTPREKKDGNW